MQLSTVALLITATGFSCGGCALYGAVAAPAPAPAPVILPEPAPPAAASLRRSLAADNPMPVVQVVSDATVDKLQGDIAALREQIVRLRADVSTLQQQARGLERAAAVNQSSADSANDQSDDPIARQEAERQRQEELTDFVADFALWVGAILPSITANQLENSEDTTLSLYLSWHSDG